MALIIGNDQTNILFGTGGEDTIAGLGGDDYLEGQGGHDNLNGGDGNDALSGGEGDDNQNGEAGNDYLHGDKGNDTIDGGEGIDTYISNYSDRTIGLIMSFDSDTGIGMIVVGDETDIIISIERTFDFKGTTFDDIIFGTSDTDHYLSGLAGNDLISGNTGGDWIFGGDGNDTLNGGADDDELRGEEGNDILNGEAGNDNLYGDTGNDAIDGGEGIDTYISNYSDRTAGLNISYDSATDNSIIVVGTETDTLISIERFFDFKGTGFNDIILGTSGADWYLSGLAGNDLISGNAGGDWIYGGDGDDTLNGGADNDELRGEAGNDNLNGEAGNDNLYGDTGNDAIDGGEGVDTYISNYSDRTAGLVMSYDSATGNGMIVIATETDTLASIENFYDFKGTGFGDIILGSSSADYFISGLAGNDLISGNAGGDWIYGGDGDDTLNGGADNDELRGEAGNDNLNGEAGNDNLYGDTGNDAIDGGEGVDTYISNYSDRTAGLNMSYHSDADTSMIVVGTETDTLISIERFFDFKGTGFNDIILGTSGADLFLSGLAGNDLISGNAGGDWIYGGDGNDTIDGGVDNDYLYGEAGNDLLTAVNDISLKPGQNEIDYLSGGGGSDRFVLGNSVKTYYDDLNISGNGNNDYAVITDFNLDEDFIQLHGLSSDYRIILNARGDASNLYFDKSGSEPDELIAILQNVSGLSPENPSFAYVKSNSQLQFSASNFTINENGTVVSPIVITRSGGSQGEVSVTVILSNGTAAKPQDYNGSSISVNFADGQISKVVNIPIINDSESETNETITLALSNPNGIALGSQSTATLTIIDDDESIPDFAGNSLGDARNLGILNGSQTLNDYVNAIDNNDYYRFELLKKSTFNLTVGALDADANIQLLNSSGLVVNSAIASLSEIGKINTTLEAGSYYLRVYHKNEATNYTLTAQGTPLQVPLQITHISPDRGSNSGQITITIDGNQFTNNATVSLIAPDNTIRNATNVLWLDEAKLVANFNLESLEAGAYDIKVTDTAGDVQRNDVFTIEEPFKENPLEIDLAVTPRLRPWNIGEVVVTYKNVGNTDILAPLFSLNLLSPSGLAEFIGSNSKYFTSSILGGVSTGRRGSGGGGGNSITLPEDIKFKVAETATFLGTGNQGDSSTLSPGETGTFRIYYSPYPKLMVAAAGGGGGGAGAGGDAERAVGAIKFSLNIIESGGAGNPINWDALKENARPITIPVDAWNVIYKNFTDALGNTSDSFQKALGENASHLGRLGEASDDTTELLAFELKQANNSLGAGILASNVDSLSPTPGLSLTFARTYLQQISSRFTLGSLGRGWTHNWESQVISENGNVIILTGEIIRFFEKRSDGTYRPQDGDYATLKAEAGGYRLTESNGLVQAFGSNGDLSSVEDPNGDRITLGYTDNKLTKLTHSNGETLTLTYNAQGHISKLTNPAGEVTTYSYDSSGETLLSVVAPEGTTNYTYQNSSAGAKAYALSQVTFPDSSQTFFNYDDQGRLIQQTQSSNAESFTYSYDAAGGITVTDASGATSKRWLNGNGQLGRFQDALGRITQFFYDDGGNLTRVIAPESTISTFNYDRQGNLSSAVDPLGHRVDLSYESKFNNLSTLQDQRGIITNYSYGNQGNLSSIAYGDGSTETFAYDEKGNLTVSVNRRGQTINYTYDNRGLLLSKIYPDGTQASFSYDSRGNLLSAIDSDSSATFTYDSANRITKVIQNDGRFLEYTYDTGGRRNRMVDHTGAVVDYDYDAVGRLSKLSDGNSKTLVTYSYDAVGRLSREDNGNGTYTTYGYDLAGQLSSIVNYAASNVVNSRYEYTYDNLGRRSSVTTLEGKSTYGYDATGQLTSATLPTGRTINYVYDASGNRIAVQDYGTSTNYSANNLNQYTQVGGDTYTYDTDGNTIAKTQNDQTSTYSYDTENRLIQVVTTDGTWSYEYDALGNRIASIINGQRTEFLLDPTDLVDVVGEYGDTGSPIARYIHGIGLVGQANGGNYNYYDTDAIGSVVGLSGATGSYLNHYSYLPFGEDLTKVEAIANPFEYVGQWGVMNEGNGLDFMRARYYDDKLGRFTSPDPIGLNGGDANLYRYAANNTTGIIDPNGTISWLGLPLVGAIGGSILGGAIGAGRYLLTTPAGQRNFADGWKQAGVESWNGFLQGAIIGIGAINLATGIGATIGVLAGAYRRNPNLLPEQALKEALQKALEKGLGIMGLPAKLLLGAGTDLYTDILKDQKLLDFGESLVLLAFDPNDILGPSGFGDQNYLIPNHDFPYTIRFENLKSATAPAVFVTVTHTIDTDLNLDTFELGDFGFGNIYVDVPDGLKAYSTSVDLTSTIGYFVDFEASLDVATRSVTWRLTTIDPLTGGLPFDPEAGFLPPNNDAHDGEGFINYTISPNANLPTNTTIDAEARIVFDFNSPIDTPKWTNTIDIDKPTSQVTALPVHSKTTFAVSWAGSDAGSGIASYDIYVSSGNEIYSLWKDDITDDFATYEGESGKTYHFYSIATDNVGLIEIAPGKSDAVTTALESIPDITLLSTSSFIEDASANDVGSVVAGFSTIDTQAVALSDIEHYALGSGLNANKVLLTAAGLALVNAGTDLPAFSITPSYGSVIGSPVVIDPEVFPTNDGSATFSISGIASVGSMLAAAISIPDPDGNGEGMFSYSWQTSRDSSTWTSAGTGAVYLVDFGGQGQQVRLQVSYTDGQGFEETLTTPSLVVRYIPSVVITSTSAFKSEGNSGGTAYTFNVTRSGDLSGASSAIWAVSGSGTNPAAASDFMAGSFPIGIVSLSVGESSQTINVNVLGDTTVELDESFTVTLSALSGAILDGAAPSASGTILNDDFLPAPSLTLLTTTTFTEDSPAHGIDAVVASFTTSDALAVALSDNLHYALGSGAESGKVLLTVAGLALVNAGSDLPAFSLTPSHGAISGLAVSVDPSVIPANDGPASLAISGTAAVGNTLAVVQQSPDSDGAGTTPSISWQTSTVGGSWSAVSTNPTYKLSTADEGKQLRAVVSYIDGQGFNESITTPTLAVPLLSTVAINASTTAQQEGNIGSTPYSFSINRSGDLSGESRVSWSVEGSGANPATALDFAGGALPAGSALFGPGQDTLSLAISVVGDGSLEPDEGFRIQLHSPIGARLSTATSTGLLQILNDDQPAPTYSFVATPQIVYEGSTLHIAITTTNVEVGRSLWWQLSGTGITAADFSDGLLSGSTLIGSDGHAAFTKGIAADAAVEQEETLAVRFFSDAARTQPVGSSLAVAIKEPSVGVVTEGNDVIIGTAAAEAVTGVPNGSAARGRGSLDRLTGGGGADIFLLGDAQGPYYDDGTSGLGSTDLALITDFTSDDRIQLHGASSAYRFISGRHGGIPGVRIDALATAPGNTPEAIGFVQGATLASLTLTNPNQFLYV